MNPTAMDTGTPGPMPAVTTPPKGRPPAAPVAVFSTELPVPPQQAWAQVASARFVADYLGARLPPEALSAGCRLGGLDAAGCKVELTVTESEPPCSLGLRVQGAAGVRALRLSLQASGRGSRLTVLHEAAGAEVAPATVDALGQLLAAPPAAVLAAPRIGSAQALVLARSYLADSAQAVRLLLAALGPRQGYRQPAPERFSLVQHLWHLADVEEFGWARRWPRVLAEQAPVLPGVDGDRLAIERRYQQRPWRGAARRFIAQRRRSLQQLARLDEAALARPLQFGGRRCDAGTLLAAMLAHDHEHRSEMASLWQQEQTAP